MHKRQANVTDLDKLCRSVHSVIDGRKHYQMVLHIIAWDASHPKSLDYVSVQICFAPPSPLYVFPNFKPMTTNVHADYPTCIKLHGGEDVVGYILEIGNK